jgi:hypothetical protein
MKNKKLWIGITFLGLTLMVASAAILLRKPPEVYAGRPIFHGETTTYRYSGEVLEHTGDVLVNVYYIGDGDPETLRAYREANIKRSHALIAQGDARLIWVQVTFAHPVPVAEVRSLVEETGFQVQDFLLAGRNSQGGKAWCVDFTGDFDQSDGFCAGLEGIMLLKGWVETTEQGLGQWLADDRVYMIDTTAVEVRELAAQRHADVVTGRKIIVGIESPFWRLDW